MRRPPFAFVLLAAAIATGSAAAQAPTPVPTSVTLPLASPTPVPVASATPAPDSGSPRPRPTQPTAVVGDRVTTRYAFVTHAAFFSVETQQSTLVDPQIFISDPRSPAGTGLQNIHHAAGFRAARMIDDPASAVANANGVPFAHDLATWFGARGSASFPVAYGRTHRLFMVFADLIPAGKYSLFAIHFGGSGVTFTPLDGRGVDNNFAADAAGAATVQVTSPNSLTSADGIVLVYHSDAQFHGRERGIVGVNAHNQLILRMP